MKDLIQVQIYFNVSGQQVVTKGFLPTQSILAIISDSVYITEACQKALEQANRKVVSVRTLLN